MNTPTVSIGLAVYNGEKYLAEAIDSVLAQSYSDFELVISDNASSDATEAICRDYADRDGRIRYVRHPQNGGAVWNFNQVISLSRGKYFKLLAHDDVIGPSYLAATVEVLETDPGVVLCHARTGIINQHGNLVRDAGSSDDEALAIQGTTVEIERLRRQCLPSQYSHRRFLGVLLYCVRCHEVFGLIRTSALRRTSLFRPFSGGEKVLLAELSLQGEFHEIPEVMAFSRWHPDRFSAISSARTQDLFMNPTASRQVWVPRQVRSVWGHWRSIRNSQLSWAEQARCLSALGRFVMQAKKWRAVLADYTRGRGQVARLSEGISGENSPSRPTEHWMTLGKEQAVTAQL